MAPLEGTTLGNRHQHYNKIVKQAIDNNRHVTKIDFNDDDIDNMMKIDIASHNRDVNYIIDVLQCDDTLYVTRAIKKSTWLVTEQQYSHIINPTYLHDHMFPAMTTKAINKLMLHIRKHLKDEIRMEAFYEYVNKNNPKQAPKWLPKCSLEFIENTLLTRLSDITLNQIKRIARRSNKIVKDFVIALKNDPYDYSYRTPLREAVLLLKRNHPDELLNIFQSLPKENRHRFSCLNASTTYLMMKKTRQRIINNFQTYEPILNLETFSKFIKDTDIKDFLVSNSSSAWVCFEKLEPFLKKVPHDDILELLRLLFGIRGNIRSENDNRSDTEVLFHKIEPEEIYIWPTYIYRWYVFAPFKIAYKDLVKCIYSKSRPEDRYSLYVILLTNASKDIDYIATVIQNYHEKRMNESYIYKIQFVNSVLTQLDAFRLNDNLWDKLNDLFHSLEVYIDSSNEVQLCIRNIIIHNLIRNQEIPEIVELKFEFNSLIEFKPKLNNEEQDKVFKFLYKHLLKKKNNENLDNETSMNRAISILTNIWTVVTDWKKQAIFHDFISQKILELCNTNIHNGWSLSMKPLYLMMKSYQRYLIEKSIILNPCEDVFLKVLRYDPRLFNLNRKEINEICCSNEISLEKLLRKIRTYWAGSLAMEWSDMYAKNIDNIAGHKAVIRGICVLTPQRKIIDFIKNYAPYEDKINWNDDNETVINIRKHIAQSMHLVRPQLPADVVLWYAKGNYLQYTVNSVLTIYNNIRLQDFENYIHMLLKTPVSLQKHGVRLAFSKLDTTQLQQISEVIWKSTRNSSIRTVIFISLFNLLCKQSETSVIDSTWKILRLFIEDLNQDENKIIYQTLRNVSNVPDHVKGEFFEKSFLLLNSLPPKAECGVLKGLVEKASEVMEFLDRSFVENTLLGSVGMYNILASNTDQRYITILAAYLLCSEDENIQLQKYNNLLTPVFEEWCSSWVNASNKSNLDGLDVLLNSIGTQLDRFVFRNKMVMPVKMLTIVKNLLCKSLSITEHYVLLTHWKLFKQFIRLFNDIMISNQDEEYSWDRIRDDYIKDLAKICATCIENDSNKYYPRLASLFADALEKLFNDFGITDLRLLNILKNMLDSKNIEVYKTVLILSPRVIFDWEKEQKEKTFNAITKKLYSYPSEEFKMYYFQKIKVKYNETNPESNSDDSDTENKSVDESGSDDSKVQIREVSNRTTETNVPRYCVLV